MEIWKDIPDYEGIYQVSNKGNVKSLSRVLIFSDGRVYRFSEKILKISPVGEGKYPTIHLYRDGVRKTLSIHKIVAQVFIPNPENKKTVNHKNGNKFDNRVENLEWMTYQENNNHAICNGLNKGTPYGVLSKLTRLNEDQILELYGNWKSKTQGKFGTKYFADKFNLSENTIRSYIKNKDRVLTQINKGE